MARHPRTKAAATTVLFAALALLVSACDLEARSEARSRRRAIQQSEEEARLARARYCTENPGECAPDDRARQQDAEARRERKAAKWRAVGQAMQPPPQAPTYHCTEDYAGKQVCRPQ